MTLVGYSQLSHKETQLIPQLLSLTLQRLIMIQRMRFLVCSTPLPPLKKLDGAEPISGPKTIKSILRSKSTFKAETLKGVIINEPSSAPAKGNKSSSASKVNSAPAGKLKSVKIKDDPPLAIVMKELNDLKLKIAEFVIYSRHNQQCDIRKPIWYLDSGCSRHMTGVKSYLHKYVEQPGPKVVFGDDSTCTTEGYGSIKCNGIVSIKFEEKRGTIFNSNKEVVIIAPRDLFRRVTQRSINHEKYTLVIVDGELKILKDRWSQDKHIELVNIIGNPRAEMLTRAIAKELSDASAHECLFVDFLSEEEPKKKRDETRIVIKNKARLVAQGYNQQEGIDYDETFALVARLEAIRIFLCLCQIMTSLLIKMDVKSAFLNGKLKEEVYVKQPPGFESNEFPNHVCKLDKALYGLKQAPRAWYETLSTFLTEHKFVRGFDLKGYSDSDYAGCNMDRKNTSGAYQLLGGKLVCWSAKKQQSVAMSSAEAEYVVVAGCCANILWMKSQLTDYDIIYEKVPIFCDNTSAIGISNNPVLHSRTRQIDIIYHFIRDHILKGDIELHFIPTQDQLADIFTKPLDEPTFKRLIVELGMLNIDSKPEASVLTEEN
ncbi:retrovirus-related pol polyprotein from transposon TNT 1-94 [Tanacetum coccineum]